MKCTTVHYEVYYMSVLQWTMNSDHYEVYYYSALRSVIVYYETKSPAGEWVSSTTHTHTHTHETMARAEFVRKWAHVLDAERVGEKHLTSLKFSSIFAQQTAIAIHTYIHMQKTYPNRKDILVDFGHSQGLAENPLSHAVPCGTSSTRLELCKACMATRFTGVCNH